MIRGIHIGAIQGRRGDYPYWMPPGPLGSRHVVPGWAIGIQANVTLTRGNLIYLPIFVDRPTTFDRLAGQVTTPAANTTARVGVYRFRRADGAPGALLLDAGTWDCTGAAPVTSTIDLTLVRNYYYLAIVCAGDADPILRGANTGQILAAPVPGSNVNAAGATMDMLPMVPGQTALVAGGLPALAVAPTDLETAASIHIWMRTNP